MALYPLFSALPQEIIYRLYFFEAYNGLFRNERRLRLVNALFFSWLHVFYHGWFAMAATLAAGLVFSRVFCASGVPGKRSLLPVAIEHALYGQILFTIGLGRYFYLAPVPVATALL
jgi:hypothetical protein